MDGCECYLHGRHRRGHAVNAVDGDDHAKLAGDGERYADDPVHGDNNSVIADYGNGDAIFRRDDYDDQHPTCWL